MKKIFKPLLLICAFAMMISAFALVGCNTKEEGEKGTDGHTHSAEFFNADESSHWRVCDICDKKFAIENHNIQSHKCSKCGYIDNYTEGLIYSYYEHEKSFSVSGIGTATDTEIIIPSYHEELPVVAIGKYAFYGCSSLESIAIPDTVIDIGYFAFEDTAYYINASNWENNVLYIGKHLIRAKEELSDSFTIKQGTLTIASEAFIDCINLTNITIPDSVASIGSEAFIGCTSLESVTIPDSVTLINAGMFNNCTSLASIIIPDSVTIIGDYAFWNCTSLASISIPDSVTSIGVAAFNGCSSLESVTIPDSVISIGGGVFINTACYNDVSNWENGVLYLGKHLIEAKKELSGSFIIKQATLTIASYAFSYCISLESIVIPGSVTTIGAGAFGMCSSLTNIAIPDSVTSIGDSAFWNCTRLESVTIGNGVTTIGRQAFIDCTSLKSIIIPDSVTFIDDFAFDNCTSLESVTFGKNSQLIAIGGRTFADCKSLISITIPDSVTSIGYGAFYDCSSLTSITIPDSVGFIDRWAFYDCINLVSINFEGTVEQWEKIRKNIGWDSFTHYTIYTIYCTDGEIAIDGTVTKY